jgi:4-amino-4-deoxy-L-arabinose transferase-like glycosyltransferase
MKSSPLRVRATAQGSRTASAASISVTGFNLLLLAGMIGLAAVFISHREADLGRLQALAESFITSLLRERLCDPALALQSFAGAIIALLVVLSWYGAGELIVSLSHRLFAETAANETESVISPALELARRCAYGAGLWSLLWFALGLCGLYRRPVAAAALVCGLALFAGSFRSARIRRLAVADEAEKGSRSVWLFRLAVVITLVPLVLALLAALAPPTGKDALIYHLALPKAFLAAGGLTEVPDNIAAYYALGVEMNGVWTLLLGGLFNPRIAESAFGAMTFAFYPLLLAAVYGWARELRLGRAEALIAAAMIAAIPTAWLSASTGYTDLALTLYLALTIHAAARWWQAARPLNLAWLALALGCALTIKLIAVFAVFPLLLLFLFRARQAQALAVRRILWSGMLALTAAGLLGSQWYLRNWIRTGSPIFPFYLSLWKGSAPGWDVTRSQMYSVFLSSYGGFPKGLTAYLLAPFRVSLTAQPESFADYDGVLGISFLLGLPLLALRRTALSVELKVAAFFSAALFVCWLFSSEQLRFLLPALPGLSVAIMAAAATLTRREGQPAQTGLIHWTLLAGALPGLLVCVAWFLERSPVRAVLGGESRAGYLTRQLDYYPYYELVNSHLPADARVWLINLRRDSYHLERPFFSDYLFEDYTLTRDVREAGDLPELRARARARGITHLLLRHDVLLDYARSPVVDEKLPEAENRQKLELLKSFLTEGTRIIRSDQKFMLIELPRA